MLFINMERYNAFSNSAMEGMNIFLSVLMFVYMGILVLMLMFSVACYVFQSLGLYTTAKRRGIHSAWLAWLPAGNMWILGSIADQYQYVTKGRIKNRRKVLLWMTAVLYLLFIPEIGAVIWMSAAAESAVSVAAVIPGGLLLCLTSVSILAVAVVACVFQYLACYDLFQSSDPKNAVLFLVMGIIFPVTLPFFVFACRNKDVGMPPRKKTMVQKILEEVAAGPEESAEAVEEAQMPVQEAEEKPDNELSEETEA